MDFIIVLMNGLIIFGKNQKKKGLFCFVFFKNSIFTYSKCFKTGSFFRMEWFFSVIVDYCHRKGRVWLALSPQPQNKIVGVALWQPPLNDGYGVSLWDMCKSGLLKAPFKMGFGACGRLKHSLEATEVVHRAIMGSKRHWSLYSVRKNLYIYVKKKTYFIIN